MRAARQGVATGDMGRLKDGSEGPNFAPGMELLAKYTFFAEGCRGHLGKQLQAHFRLNEGRDAQTYGIGLKELWEIKPEQHQEGLVIHTGGWPLNPDTYGGGFLPSGKQPDQHRLRGRPRLREPYLSPYEEFQRFKTHPEIRKFLEGGKRIAYGARALAAGGLQSLPKLVFPVACWSATMPASSTRPASRVRTARSNPAPWPPKPALRHSSAGRAQDELTAFPEKFKESWLYEELYRARNFKPWMAKGMQYGGLMFGIDQMLFRGKAPWTLHHAGPDHKKLKKAADCQPIAYPKPDGVVSFDRSSSVFLSNTNHEEDQPCHLTLKGCGGADQRESRRVRCPRAALPLAGCTRSCAMNRARNPKLQINAQNCVHCKTCDIKDPTQNINWVVPQGGEGPTYPNM